MILGKIDDIIIDSSLTDLISLDCINSNCQHHGCCYCRVTLSNEEIKKISDALPNMNLPKKIKEYLRFFNFYTYDKSIRLLTDIPTCIFFNNGGCLLEQYNVSPIQCRAFPIILSSNTLRLDNSCDLACLKAGSVPAFQLLEKEIIMLTSQKFYNKLSELLSTEHKGLFFLSSRK